jgi:hypothetical protein
MPEVRRSREAEPYVPEEEDMTKCLWCEIDDNALEFKDICIGHHHIEEVIPFLGAYKLYRYWRQNHDKRNN